MDHGMRYEHDELYQKLFCTGEDSARWQLTNAGYKVAPGLVGDFLMAGWDDGTGIEVRFVGGLVDKIFTCQYYANMSDPSNIEPQEVVRRPRKGR